MQLPVRPLPDNNAVPWHLISELFASGTPIDELSLKFNLPQKTIQRRLDLALSASGHIRSNAEINQCSHKVKSDLISTLLKMSSSLANAKSCSDDKNALLKLERLTNVAARLFSWPSAKSIDVSASALASNPASRAINLELVRKKPDNLDSITPQNSLQQMP